MTTHRFEADLSIATVTQLRRWIDAYRRVAAEAANRSYDAGSRSSAARETGADIPPMAALELGQAQTDYQQAIRQISRIEEEIKRRGKRK